MVLGINTGAISFNEWETESWAPLLNSDGDGNLCKEKMKSSDKSEQVAAAAAAAEEKTSRPAGKPPTGKRKKRNGKQPMEGGASEKTDDEDAAGGGGGGGGEGGKSNHELHIYIERERRKKMRTMFSNLHALLPQLPSKADKSTIVDEAVNYIKTLQQKLHGLQKRKLEILQGITMTTTLDPRGKSVAMPPPPPAPAMGYYREAFLADQGSSSSAIATGPIGFSRFSSALKTWASPNMVLRVCGDKAQINICCPKKIGLFGSVCSFLENYNLQVLSAHVSTDEYRSMIMIQAQASVSVELLSNAAVSIDDLFQLAAGEIAVYLASI